MNSQAKSRYPEVYARAERDPEGFWAEAAEAIDWIEQPKKIFDKNAGVYGRWFTGGVVNTCWNAIDRHVKAGRGKQPALVYDSPVSGQKRTITYTELLAEVSALAAVLKDFGVTRATASFSICRWCRKRSSPCLPARASARSIRWCSAASRRRSLRPASTTPSRN